MDIIYSRKRFKNFKYDNKVLKLIVIIFIAIFVMINTLEAINPIFENVCIQVSQNRALIIINKITTDVIEENRDSEVVSIKYDEEGKLQMLQVNSVPINFINSEILDEIQKYFENNEYIYAKIPFGSITGIRFLSGIGPQIPLKIMYGNVAQTKIKSEFDDSGINQTIHRLYLEVICDIAIYTPYENLSTQVTSEILLSENIIVGDIPNLYMNK